MAELRLVYWARKADCAMTMAVTIESEPARLDTETDATFRHEMIAELNGEPFSAARPLPVFDQVQQRLRKMAVA